MLHYWALHLYTQELDLWSQIHSFMSRLVSLTNIRPYIFQSNKLTLLWNNLYSFTVRYEAIFVTICRGTLVLQNVFL